ncbi:MAG: dGTPase [Candidatus Endobugula sp.]|jgi:dGTPase
MKKDYFTVERLRKSTSKVIVPPKQQFESDRGRVLFSAPLRRLQSKAQVFSLESNAAVRSRLTHSIEVAHVGRYITHQLTKIAKEKNDKELIEQCLMIEPLVETACLLHDIGNPPFGHLGERAIQDWFGEHAEKLYDKSLNKKIDKKNTYYTDFENFDGNPQGARIVVTLQGKPDQYGLNLTAAQIGTIIKYPQFSNELIESNSQFKKIAAFTSEKKQINKAWGMLGLEWGERHPLVFLMEASDDIAYSLSDIEDGIEKGIITEPMVMDFLSKEFDVLSEDIRNCIPEKDSRQLDVVTEFVGFRTNMINLLTQKAALFFYENQSKLSTGSIKAIFDNGDDYSKALKIIGSFCREKLYCSKEAEDIEIAGYNVVHGLLDKFSLLMKLEKEGFAKLVMGEGKNNLERRMFSKLPNSLVKHYSAALELDADNEWFLRFQLIVDYVSGMTDDYALKLYRLLHGIEVSIV